MFTEKQTSGHELFSSAWRTCPIFLATPSEKARRTSYLRVALIHLHFRRWTTAGKSAALTLLSPSLSVGMGVGKKEEGWKKADGHAALEESGPDCACMHGRHGGSRIRENSRPESRSHALKSTRRVDSAAGHVPTHTSLPLRTLLPLLGIFNWSSSGTASCLTNDAGALSSTGLRCSIIQEVL